MYEQRFEGGRWGQQAQREGLREPATPQYVQLVNLGNEHAIDVKENKCQDRQPLLVYPKKQPAAPNQLFLLEPAGNGTNQFFIASSMNTKYVLDIKGGKAKSGEDVILFERKTPPCSNQLWDWQGNTLHSAMGNDLVLASHGSGNSCKLIVETRNGHPNQTWREAR